MRRFTAFLLWSSVPEQDRPINGNSEPMPGVVIKQEMDITEKTAVNVPGPLELKYGAEGWVIHTSPGLISNVRTASDSALAVWKANPLPPSPKEKAEKIKAVAGSAGRRIFDDYSKRNIELNKSDKEISNIMEHPEMAKLAIALLSGSLKYARGKVASIDTFDGFDQDDKDWLLGRLDAILGG